MDWKLGYGSLGLIALLLCGGLVYYQLRGAPADIPMSISFYPAPVLNPYPELEGLKVNVNTATVEELQQLPNIGETRAKAIRTFVREAGGIRRAEQLLSVDGIGETILEDIRPFLTFD